MTDSIKNISALIRDIPDFPSPGIVFKDLTPLLRDPSAMATTSRLLAAPFADQQISAVVGMEARGFIFGTLVARELNAGFIPLRKPGKLPAATHAVSYDLEYGSAELHMHTDALNASDRVLLVDDLIATGGTAKASVDLVEHSGAEIIGTAFVVELEFLNGRSVLDGYDVHALVRY